MILGLHLTIYGSRFRILQCSRTITVTVAVVNDDYGVVALYDLNSSFFFLFCRFDGAYEKKNLVI